jgi:hypothetical protein
MNKVQLKPRLRVASLIVLAVGLCAALLIHLFVEDVPDDSLGYAVVDGALYPLSTQDSKAYRREVERFGGKAALAFDDFNRWFAHLWQGKKLAKTVAWISVLLALGIYLFANALGPDAPPQATDESERDESG